jgi:hypothetical protein
VTAPTTDVHLVWMVDEGRLPTVTALQVPATGDVTVRLEAVNAGWAAAVSIVGPPAAIRAFGEQIAAAAGGGEATA